MKNWENNGAEEIGLVTFTPDRGNSQEPRATDHIRPNFKTGQRNRHIDIVKVRHDFYDCMMFSWLGIHGIYIGSGIDVE